MKVKAYVPSVPAESELNLALEQDEVRQCEQSAGYLRKANI